MTEAELCIRDKNGYIVAWQAGYSEREINNLLEKHKEDGWHRSYAKYTSEGLR